MCTHINLGTFPFVCYTEFQLEYEKNKQMKKKIMTRERKRLSFLSVMWLFFFCLKIKLLITTEHSTTICCAIRDAFNGINRAWISIIATAAAESRRRSERRRSSCNSRSNRRNISSISSRSYQLSKFSWGWNIFAPLAFILKTIHE